MQRVNPRDYVIENRNEIRWGPGKGVTLRGAHGFDNEQVTTSLGYYESDRRRKFEKQVTKSVHSGDPLAIIHCGDGAVPPMIDEATPRSPWSLSTSASFFPCYVP